MNLVIYLLIRKPMIEDIAITGIKLIWDINETRRITEIGKGKSALATVAIPAVTATPCGTNGKT